MLDKSSQFLSLEQPSEPKILDVALNITGIEKKIRSKRLRLPSTWRPFDLNFERKGALTGDGGNLCPPWSVILKSVSPTPLSCDTVGREL